MFDLYTYYNNKIRLQLFQEFKYNNPLQIPKLSKITINTGLGLLAQNSKHLNKSIEEFSFITGQYPVLTFAQKSISNFKLRSGMPIGLMVTLRKQKMYTFLTKLIHFSLPNLRDFRGLKINSFDLGGNYNFGISDQSIFPDINIKTIEFKQGFNITLVTTAKTKKEAFFLLTQLGVPFQKIK